ncbi:hypothetical protein SARC_02541 [Sphaeroforma arctica JP610]|uniref:Uncharacterized protein n=1 Tax=Sphaeroforma arctica JP610 TaxID=667725 RepID=A0A0L0G8B7_9EUKA|nr:hypothetical protein SARC_02541 [Sphaeroforma arctica JP610]KNC85282.1 hypothetical protein SARC_02541 [Sphaeroforma arctica JP610]|eukprot:XP_014159184.1 hypothetical protein SARC_02541 [Sphaeroforma arctica JP610]
MVDPTPQNPVYRIYNNVAVSHLFLCHTQLHEDDEILTVWAVDDQCENHITPNEALAQVVMALFGLFALYKTVVYCKGDMSMPPLAKKEMSDPCAERNYQQI